MAQLTLSSALLAYLCSCLLCYMQTGTAAFFFKLDLQTQVFPPSPVFLLISVSLAAPFPPYPRSSILRQSLVRHCFQAKSSLPFPHSLTPCVNLDES